MADAAANLLAGNLVAFPTETVYGLGADATNKDAIFINLPKNLKNSKIRTELIYEYPLQVPIKKFEKVAVLKIYNNKDLIDTQDLFAQKDITNKNIFFKGIQNISHYILQ